MPTFWNVTLRVRIRVSISAARWFIWSGTSICSAECQGFIHAPFGRRKFPQTSEIPPISEVCMIALWLLTHLISVNGNDANKVAINVATIPLRKYKKI